MPGLRNKLTVASVKAVTTPGRHADGAGLYLQVTKHAIMGNVRKSWVVRYRAANGKIREMGVGSVEDVTLADARDRATAIRKDVKEGTDAVEARIETKLETLRVRAASITFAQCAEAYVKAHESGWKNEKHKAQWTATLKTYAYPIFGKVAVQDINVGMVMKVLDPIWQTKTETASRLRGRLENILDWATVREYRTGENPARWRGHLEKALPARNKAKKVKHHAALPIDEYPAFMKTLRDQKGIGPLAFQFAILTAARTSEAIAARWDEIDLNDKSWTVPSERMKAGRIHRVPLSAAALAVLREVRGIDPVYPFPGLKGGKPISNMAFLMTLRRMKREDLTAHGFRSTFRDWAAERTDFQNEVAEAALAHVISNQAEAAYRRGDLFEKRRALMEAWGVFGIAQ
jgi:integrase